MSLNVPVVAPQPQRDYTDYMLTQTPEAGQTFVPNQFLSIGAGVVFIATTASTGLFGMALANAVDPVFGKPNATLPVLRVRERQRYLMNVNGTLAQASVGSKYGLLVNAEGIGLVDLTNTTQALFEVVEIYSAGILPNGGIGDVNPRVLVEILPGVVQ